jgi:hypothetical protein
MTHATRPCQTYVILAMIDNVMAVLTAKNHHDHASKMYAPMSASWFACTELGSLLSAWYWLWCTSLNRGPYMILLSRPRAAEQQM